MKPDLLLVSPVFPAPSGNGAAMRCHAFLRVLAERHRVSLLVVNRPPPPRTRADVAPLCAEIACVAAGLWERRGEAIRRVVARAPALYQRVFPEPREWARARRAAFPYPFRVRDFAAVHLFRFYVAPVLETLAADVSWRSAWLDLDELESPTRLCLARLHAASGDHAAAAWATVEARQYAALERARLGAFDRLFVCSAVEGERVRAAGLHPAPEIAPNVIADAAAAPAGEPGARRDRPFRFLFVGTLGYPPNADAVRQFAFDVLPLLRARGVRACFDVVGGGLAPRLARDLAGDADVRMHGFVPDLAAVYRNADAVVAPLRAGGGTRIKILEAFAHGRPVVATAAAVEGIDVRHGRDLLIGELREEFTAHCTRLAREPELAAALALRARALVRECYSEAALRAVLFATDLRAATSSRR